MRRALRLGAVVVLLLVVAAAVPPVRRAVLTGLGRSLVASDALEPGDVVAISESGDPSEFQAAMLEAADLYQRAGYTRVVLLRAAGEAVDEELTRRGVKLADPAIETLRQLGIPAERIEIVDAGEGGTTESTHALAMWVRAHRSRVLVVIGATHSRRYRRALLRVWPADAPPPRVTYPRRTIFRPENWWTYRRTLREGLLELQKLALDCAVHPF